MKRITLIIALLVALLPLGEAYGQVTVGASLGTTMSSFRPYPYQETRTTTGLYTGGVGVRYYTAQRFVGAIGLDVEFMERAYSFAPYASYTAEGEDHAYYTRYYNSIMIPFMWQPYVYMFHNKVRVFIEAGATFSINLASTYVNEAARDFFGAEDWQGEYIYKTARDNRFCYGLMGGGGITYLHDRYEFFVRARYYFGYSDILKNRTKYYTNNNDGSDNPFYYTPTRSPVDNISLSIGFNYRLGKGDGFDSWKTKAPDKLERSIDFNYTGKVDAQSSSSSDRNSSSQSNRSSNRSTNR